VAFSQKTQYALRAVLDLALHYGEGPRRISDIAAAQDIPEQFLQVILNQLKAEFVAARRGHAGGYYLRRAPAEISMADVIRFVQGPISPVVCSADQGSYECRFRGACVFLPVWEEAEAAVNRVYQKTSFADLAERERARVAGTAGDYSI
jgi:Rrf2 family protein